MRTLLGFAAASLAALGAAGPPCGPRAAARRIAVARSDAVVVPFAVPVAVPVATVRVPSVLYAYGSSVAPVANTTEPAAGTGGAPPAAERVLRARCSACHQGAAARGGLMIFDDQGALRTRLPRRLMWHMIAEGKMPPEGAAELGEADRRAIEEWARVPSDLEW